MPAPVVALLIFLSAARMHNVASGTHRPAPPAGGTTAAPLPATGVGPAEPAPGFHQSAWLKNLRTRFALLPRSLGRCERERTSILAPA